jgi:POT family proton-dependent oligopeptide transporter
MGKSSAYASTPTDTKGMPPGIPFIIGNEAAERFSFYGMRAILVVFMTQYLLDASGNDATMGDEEAKSVYHLFVAAAYFTPMLGALISDIFFGKYRTILFISLLYCFGHGLLALMDLGPHMGTWDMKPFLYSGLFLIALGAGGIKPCVSAHVGDQFGSGNKHLMTQVFNWFYFSINLGAAASQFMTPWLLAKYGPAYAFGLPGVLMAIATFVFWLGRHRFVHVPASGWKKFKEETFSPAGRRALLNLSPLFLIFVPMFWAIFDQTGSAWVLQADQMDRQLGITWLPSQIQFVNPVLILLGIPIFTYGVYPLMGKFFKVTPLRKIGIGLALTAGSFVVTGVVEEQIQDRQESIASTMYSDLAADLRRGQDPTLGNPDTIAKAAIVAGERSALTTERFKELSTLSPNEMLGRIEQSRIPKLLTDETREAIASELNLSDPSVLKTSLQPIIEADWDASKLAEYGLTFERLAGFMPDGALAEMLTLEEASRIFEALSTEQPVVTDEGETTVDMPSNLAAAVKAARAVWVVPSKDPDAEADPDAKPVSDEQRIVSTYLNQMPNIIWQFLAYLILTSAEIMVSIVCLEFAYSQSPRKMKSFIMGVYFLGVSLGNFFVSGVNAVIIQIRDVTGTNPLEGANYYWFFAGLMFLVSMLYIPFALRYKGETFIQGEEDKKIDHEEATAEGPDA